MRVPTRQDEGPPQPPPQHHYGNPRASSAKRSPWRRSIGAFFVPERAPGSGPVPKTKRSKQAAERFRSWSRRTTDVVPVAPSEEPADQGVRTIALTLGILGLSLLVFLAYAFVFTGFQEAREQRSLLNAYQSESRGKLLSLAPVPEGDPVGVLLIPHLGLRQVIVLGTSATDLLKGPGLMPGTSLPGTFGNSVIAGRRSTAGAPFGSIGQLRPGDSITVVTVLGSFRYRVVRVGTAAPGQVDPISQTDNSSLTLVTSNPPILVTGHEYVTSRLVSKPATAPLPTTAPSLGQRGLSGDSSAVIPSVLWGIVLVGAVVVTIGLYRRQPGHAWPIYLLSTPVLVAVMLLWFENLFSTPARNVMRCV